MEKTVLGLMDTYQEAEDVIRDLMTGGFRPEDIGFACVDESTEETEKPAKGTRPIPAERAAAGATLGGVTGLVIGIVTVAIPGIGPILAAGPVGTALAGGGIGFAAGGIIGALTGAGVPEEEAHSYAEGVRRGGVLVTVRAEDDMADRAMAVLRRHDAIDIAERAEHWRTEGWSRFDEHAGPCPPETRARERKTARHVTEEAELAHFQKTYPGEEYGSYRSAYAFGAEVAEAHRYRGRSWSRIENEVREEWECNNPGPWDQYKEAIHHGWEKRARVAEEA
jgi:hypothetical protein